MRKILAPVLFVFTAAALLTGCKKNAESSLTPVTLNEVAHSIFYAPSMPPSSWGILRRRESI